MLKYKYYVQVPNGHLIASFDPFGHVAHEAFPEYYARGYDIRPSIAG